MNKTVYYFQGQTNFAKLLGKISFLLSTAQVVKCFGVYFMKDYTSTILIIFGTLLTKAMLLSLLISIRFRDFPLTIQAQYWIMANSWEHFWIQS